MQGNAIIASCLLLALASPSWAQRDLKQIPDPDPELERRSFQLAPGFEVNLYASDPLLAKPIQMNFDARGRLWVACSEAYPQIEPGKTANDKIIILEDLNRDGKADKTTVFADGLLIPTGVEPGDGGAYVANSTELVHLRDVDGDGKSDQRRIVLSGFGTEDTHHILHTFRWGHDGCLYFNQSIYIHSHIETPHGVRRLNAGGIWQLRPNNGRLEIAARGFCNPWGLHFDRHGQWFATDGAYGEGINFVVPGASYVFCQPPVRILAGLNPGSPKHCGLEIVSGRHLPEDWQGSLLTNDFRGHRVCRFVLSDDGAGFSSQEKPELIKTSHAAFRPIDVKMGPDGAIYIADWYNPIIQHGEVDFRDPRRDHTHGRIWRVTAKRRQLAEWPNLEGSSTKELLDYLLAPESWTAQHARGVLRERGQKAIQQDLEKWVNDHANNEQALLEALWIYQSLDVAEPSLLRRVLKAKDGRIRSAAVRVLSSWHERIGSVMELLESAVADDHPRVRLEAVRGLGQVARLDSAELAARALGQPMDRWIDYALWQTMRELAPQWLPRAHSNQQLFDGRVLPLLFALEAVSSPEVVDPLSSLVQSGRVPPEQQARALALLASLGGPTELGRILDTVVAKAKSTPNHASSLLADLVVAARQRKVVPKGDLTRLRGLIKDGDLSLRVAATQASGLWRVMDLRDDLASMARDGGIEPKLRQSAIESLALIGEPKERAILTELAAGRESLATRRMAIVALTEIEIAQAAKLAAPWLSEAGGEEEVATVFEAFIQKKQGGQQLARALAPGKVAPESARIGMKVIRGSGRAESELAAALAKSIGAKPGQRILSAPEMRALVEAVQAKGDARRGESMFRRADLGCLKCHAIAGAGGLVGPDLTSIGASAPLDYLVESLLVPNKAIKENYHSTVVTTKDGKLFAGVKSRQTERELGLRDSEDREILIPRSNIEDMANGPSMMPEGLVDGLTHAELVDLVRFLHELGRTSPTSVVQARYVRRWQALMPDKASYTLISRDSYAALARPGTDLTWVPAYSTLGGELTLAGLPEFEYRNPVTRQLERKSSFLRCQLDVTVGGKASLALNDALGLRIWLDGEPLTVNKTTRFDVGQGIRTLTIAIDLTARSTPLRFELLDEPGSALRAKWLGGK